MTVRGIEKVNGRDAYLVVGVPQGDTPESLYFDTQTGLLLRKQTVLPTPIGDSPFQMDFDDYRDTGSGVKFPFLIHMNPANRAHRAGAGRDAARDKVEDNKPIDDAKFAKPAARSPCGPSNARPHVQRLKAAPKGEQHDEEIRIRGRVGIRRGQRRGRRAPRRRRSPRSRCRATSRSGR